MNDILLYITSELKSLQDEINNQSCCLDNIDYHQGYVDALSHLTDYILNTEKVK